ncbi:MAG: SAM-dependent methyltransferase [Polyangiales bacterium]
MTRYDSIGHHYATRRREDPRIMERIDAALEGAKTVVNVGAGTGSYEPRRGTVYPVEPSHVMASQRPVERPAIRGVATALPFHDQSVDAAMSVLSLHHWEPGQEEGVREMCRVARQSVVIVTFDAEVSAKMWLMADYFPEVRELDLKIFPHPDEVVSWLDRPATIEVLPAHRDTPDRNLSAFWAHPEWVLDEAARAVTSGFARQSPDVVRRVVGDVTRDLESGEWERKYGALRSLEEFDTGLRLIRAGR